MSYLLHANIINGDCFFLSFFTSFGRLSSKLYNIRLPALISSILNITDTVRTVKVCVV